MLSWSADMAATFFLFDFYQLVSMVVTVTATLISLLCNFCAYLISIYYSLDELPWITNLHHESLVYTLH